MIKAIIIMAMVLIAAGAAPTAHAGPYCDSLGNSPSITEAQRVIIDAVRADDSEGIANDIVDNCPAQYDIIMEAGNQLLQQLGG